MVLPSRSNGLVLGAALLLAGCSTSVTALQGGAQEISQASRQNYDLLQKDAKDMLTYKAPPAPKPVPPSYCYRVLQDITCYHTPVAGAEMRLVAYQGPADDEAKPVLASADVPQQAVAAPTPVMPTPLTASPQPSTPAQQTKTAQSVAHFAAQKPVTVGAPPAVKGDASSPAQ